MRRVPKKFFEQKTLVVARKLLGMYLVRKIGKNVQRETITEVEAYVGPHDLASHSSKGRTLRTEVMYAEAGTLYVYFVYGMHYMLNIVTEKCGFPAAVLIRSTAKVRGPGRVAREFSIDKTLNGQKLGAKSGVWIEVGPKKKRTIMRTPRIGVAYAGTWAAKPYRFVLTSSSF